MLDNYVSVKMAAQLAKDGYPQDYCAQYWVLSSAPKKVWTIFTREDLLVKVREDIGSVAAYIAAPTEDDAVCWKLKYIPRQIPFFKSILCPEMVIYDCIIDDNIESLSSWSFHKFKKLSRPDI